MSRSDTNSRFMSHASLRDIRSIPSGRFYFELTLDVDGTLVKTHRGMGRRRPISVGTEMLVYIDRIFIMHEDNTVETVENPHLAGKVIRRD